MKEIEIDDEVLVVTYTKPTKSGRRTVVNVGRARMIEKDGDDYKVKIICGSLIAAGCTRTFPRKELYLMKSGCEVDYFKRLINFYFSNGEHPGVRPKK